MLSPNASVVKMKRDLKYLDHMLLEISFESKTIELHLGRMAYCHIIEHYISVDLWENK